MTKVLLLAPISDLHAGIGNFGIPSLGVHRIAAYLRKCGENVRVYDCNIDGDFDTWANDDHFDTIGVSILADTLPTSISFIKKLRSKYPKAIIVAGGIEATLNYQEIIENSPVDAVLLGEGERTMYCICKKISLEYLDGVVLKKPALPISNELLWEFWDTVDFSRIPYQKYWGYTKSLHTKESGETEPLIRLVTSSHCNKRCTFCSVRKWHQSACNKEVSVAYLNAEQVDCLLSRIEKQQPECKRIYFVEDDLLVARQRGYELISVFKKHKFKYLIQTSTPKITEDLVREFAKANVVHITFGVESASSYLRKAFNKPQDEQKIEDIIDWCNKYGVICYYLIILLPPATRINDLIISYQTLTRWIKKGVKVSVEPLVMPYRGAPIWDSEDHEVNSKITNNLKQPVHLWPDDPEVNRFAKEFMDEWPEFKEKKMKEEGQKHTSKGFTGNWYVELLGIYLRRRGML